MMWTREHSYVSTCHLQEMKLTAPKIWFAIFDLAGGAVNDIAMNATAYAHRDALVSTSCLLLCLAIGIFIVLSSILRYWHRQRLKHNAELFDWSQ